MSNAKKYCFIIGPIGEEDSDVRKRSDQLRKHVIKPPVETLGYSTIRADEISEPGLITNQIIQHIVDDPLVVADLTGSNPNVFYELALRHAVRKPLIQLIRTGDILPFDVAGMRTISVDLTDPDSIEKARSDIAEQVSSLEGKKPEDLDSPVLIATRQPSFRQKWPQDFVPLDQLIAIERDASSQWDHIRLACSHTLWSLWPDRAKHVLQNQLGDWRDYVGRHARFLLDHCY